MKLTRDKMRAAPEDESSTSDDEDEDRKPPAREVRVAQQLHRKRRNVLHGIPVARNLARLPDQHQQHDYWCYCTAALGLAGGAGRRLLLLAAAAVATRIAAVAQPPHHVRRRRRTIARAAASA